MCRSSIYCIDQYSEIYSREKNGTFFGHYYLNIYKNIYTYIFVVSRDKNEIKVDEIYRFISLYRFAIHYASYIFRK